nr:MAG TPA: hypothetical protein [Caudoviricetes sp.]
MIESICLYKTLSQYLTSSLEYPPWLKTASSLSTPLPSRCLTLKLDSLGSAPQNTTFISCLSADLTMKI